MNIQAIADLLNEPITKKRAIAVIAAQTVVSYAIIRQSLSMTTKNAERIIDEQYTKMLAMREMLEFSVENLDDAALDKLDEMAGYWNIVLPKEEK